MSIFSKNRPHRHSADVLEEPAIRPDAIAIAEDRPDLTRAALTATAVHGGRAAGESAASGFHHAETVEALPSRRALAPKAGERRELVVREGRRLAERLRAKTDGLRRLHSVECTRADAAETVEGERRMELEAIEKRLPAHRGSGGVGYFALLAVLAAAEYPTIINSLRASLLEPWSVTVISIALSIIVAACAHVVGSHLASLVGNAKSSGAEGTRERWVDAVIVGAVGLGMIALMFALWKTRTNLFDGIIDRREKEGLRTDGIDAGLLSTTLFILQVVLFVLAATWAYRRGGDAPANAEARELGRSRRRVKRLVKRAEKEARAAASTRDAVGSELQRAETSVGMLAEVTESVLRQEAELLETLYAEHDGAFTASRHAADRDQLDPVITANRKTSEFEPLEV